MRAMPCNLHRLILMSRDFRQNRRRCCACGYHLLRNRPFPNIYYFEKGVRSAAIDVGGVRRDFVTRLCENLFKDKKDPGVAQGKFLELDGGFPSGEQEEAFRTLGCLFSLCYPENSYFKTGPLFHEGVYRCLLAPGEPGSDEWLLSNYLEILGAPAAAKQLIDLSKETPTLQAKELEFLAYLVDPAASDLSPYTQDYFNDKTNRESLRNALLDTAKQNQKLKAISRIAGEMKRKLGTISGQNLQDRIEGVINAAALKGKLEWGFSGNISDPQKTVGYLTAWIDRSDKAKLETFVRAVTGNRTLCADNIIIQVFDRGREFIPVSHTCSFTLELSGNYETQEKFNQKLEFFLEHSLAGSGFTAA